ncbi:MAG: hypothetical protein RJA10_3284 [Pseudomonadota bacterium]|jgi:hypothetical protein
MTQRPPDPPPYRPSSPRRRLLIAGVAVAMGFAVMATVLWPHVRFLRVDKARQMQDKPACTAEQTEGCVGGVMGVIKPAAAPASGPR